MKLKTRLFGRSDNFGNDIILKIFHNEEEGYDVGCTIFLKLKSESRHRNLGYLYLADKSFHVLRDSSKHFHYKTKSYGFNWSIINDAVLNIKTIHLIINKSDKYIIPISVLDSFGKFLNFQQQGFELQKFLPMDIIQRFKDESYNPKEDPLTQNDDEI